MTGHLVGHVVRRGVQHVHEHYTKKQYIEKLEHDASLYENQTDPEMDLKPQELLPVAITAIIALLIIWSVCRKRQPDDLLRGTRLTDFTDRLYHRPSHVLPCHDREPIAHRYYRIQATAVSGCRARQHYREGAVDGGR